MWEIFYKTAAVLTFMKNFAPLVSRMTNLLMWGMNVLSE
jgi:hypothetical protein